ncbi:MAG: hypothetical protein J4432_02050 [DPANN group archaeon]|nr:hypothetical protein [DPANN group archaeon]
MWENSKPTGKGQLAQGWPPILERTVTSYLMGHTPNQESAELVYNALAAAREAEGRIAEMGFTPPSDEEE